jgi:phospholipid-binding lipoprotein MlaA
MNRFHKQSRLLLADYFLFGLMLALIVGLNGCATTKAPVETSHQDDPYENVNRNIYGFNDKVDDFVAKPISDGYKFITPDFMETGVSNFFNNLKSINIVLNDVLQAKFEQGGRDTGRFLMNSTLGLAGLFDVAKNVGLEQNDEDFEQTLAVWGVPQGSYIVLPLLGPITTRGIPGAVFDSAANPVNYVGAPVQIISLINSRANAEGALKFIDEAALDPYVFTRESFLQWRNHLATDGKSGSSSELDGLDIDLIDDNQSAEKKTGTNNARVTALPSAEVNNSPASTNKNALQILPADPVGAGKNSVSGTLKPEVK